MKNVVVSLLSEIGDNKLFGNSLSLFKIDWRVIRLLGFSVFILWPWLLMSYIYCVKICFRKMCCQELSSGIIITVIIIRWHDCLWQERKNVPSQYWTQHGDMFYSKKVAWGYPISQFLVPPFFSPTTIGFVSSFFVNIRITLLSVVSKMNTSIQLHVSWVHVVCSYE